jgi:hypothetical protein
VALARRLNGPYRHVRASMAERARRHLCLQPVGVSRATVVSAAGAGGSSCGAPRGFSETVIGMNDDSSEICGPDVFEALRDAFKRVRRALEGLLEVNTQDAAALARAEDGVLCTNPRTGALGMRPTPVTMSVML